MLGYHHFIQYSTHISAVCTFIVSCVCVFRFGSFLWRRAHAICSTQMFACCSIIFIRNDYYFVGFWYEISDELCEFPKYETSPSIVDVHLTSNTTRFWISFVRNQMSHIRVNYHLFHPKQNTVNLLETTKILKKIYSLFIFTRYFQLSFVHFTSQVFPQQAVFFKFQVSPRTVVLPFKRYYIFTCIRYR